MKKTLLLLVALITATIAFAYDVQIDGIYYNLNDETETAEVTSGINKYSGNISIPEKVTYNDTEYSVTEIGNGAFRYCKSLTSISIPNSVTKIGKKAFVWCQSLSLILIHAENPPIVHQNAFTKVPTSVTIKVPKGSIEKYKTANIWDSFTNYEEF